MNHPGLDYYISNEVLVQVFVGLNDNLPLIVHTTFVPIGSVEQVCFTCILTGGYLRDAQFFVRSSLSFTLFGYPTLWMCHFATIYSAVAA